VDSFSNPLLWSTVGPRLKSYWELQIRGDHSSAPLESVSQFLQNELDPLKLNLLSPSTLTDYRLFDPLSLSPGTIADCKALDLLGAWHTEVSAQIPVLDLSHVGGYSIQNLLVEGRFGEVYKALAGASTPSANVPASGQKLAALENAKFKLQLELDKYKSLILNGIADREAQSTAGVFASDYRCLTAGKFVDLTDGAFSEASALYQIFYGRDPHSFECAGAVFRAVGRKLAELSREVRNRIGIVKQRLAQTRSRYCGLSWSRRFWYLMHGSHPPKTEGCLAFGYAASSI
jgi:hypothetical protein